MLKLESSGIVTAYCRTGQGAPLFLLHGAEADHAMFDELVERLQARFTVFAYDQRDSGQTSNPEVGYSLNDLADDAAALIRGLGYHRAHVMGTSLGGVIAQVVAARHPDCIDRLILSSTWKVNKSPAEINPAAFAALAGYRTDARANAPRIAEYFFPADFLRERPELIEMFRGSKRSDGQRLRRAALLAQPADSIRGAFARPTLLLAGAEDRLIPYGETFALEQDFAICRKQLIAGVGHVSAIQSPDRVAQAAAAFLEEQINADAIG